MTNNNDLMHKDRNESGNTLRNGWIYKSDDEPNGISLNTSQLNQPYKNSSKYVQLPNVLISANILCDKVTIFPKSNKIRS